MTELANNQREGSLEAPIRDPIDWKRPHFYDEGKLFEEMERVYDVCHGCRRCVSLCNAFPTLFDLVDGSKTMELDGVDKNDYVKVVDDCYLCDLCFMTKCPYVPPHPWGIDFPHLMLRAKALKHKQGKNKFSHKLLTSTDAVGSFAGVPIVSEVTNATLNNATGRKLVDKMLGVHPEAHVPRYERISFRKRYANRHTEAVQQQEADTSHGKVALFVTCYGNRNEPQLVEDLVSVFEHSKISVALSEQEKCCGMPKLELGDLDSVEKAKEFNIPRLLKLIDEGFDIIAPVPSCVLMFKQELSLLFADDEGVQKVQSKIFDPFEYLMLKHKDGKFNTEFKNTLGRIAYHVPCHQRVQNIGLKTRDVLALVPDTTINVVERCSGHDGTYGVRSETFEKAKKICGPIVNKLKQSEFDYYVSDCPLAGHHIALGLEEGQVSSNPFALLRHAYGV